MEQVEQLFNSFENKLLEISLYGSFIVDESTNKYKEYLMKFSKIDTLKDEKIVGTRLVYWDILSNHKKILSDAKIEKNVNELLESAEYHNNKQLQWLFVEAYELYEKHIDDLYSLIGYLDNNFWDLQDFGKVSIDDIKIFTHEDFANKVLKKENRPYSIIEVFEKKLNLKKYDDIKEPFRNYSFLVALLSELRNAIVHDNGFLDRKRLSKKLLKKYGINGNSNKEIYENMISNFFGSQEYEKMICLTKIPKANEVVKDLFYTDRDRFKEIIGILISYIKLISDLLIKRMKS
ncbi:hypothetical protein [Sulfurospirillum cavolei]|uniref:hypothetical protein n=1 Tax=Sulfurospirillum cavolei TaxID=366522 RepID=UPI000764B1D8|nr:hypothetical protein [Sulfurospirillum cavolei]